MDRKRWGLEVKVYEAYCENSGHLWCNLSVDRFENHEKKGRIVPAEQVCIMDRMRWGLDAKVYDAHSENNGHLWCNLSVGLWSAVA